MARARTRRISWRRSSQEPERTGIHPGGAGSRRLPLPRAGEEPEYRKAKILERIVEPSGLHLPRPWIDDKGEVQVNRLSHPDEQRHRPLQGRPPLPPSVNAGILKFLAFEQVFKNSLTTLPWAARAARLQSQGQERQRGHALLPELHERAVRHIGADTDVPAGTSALADARSASLRAVQEAAQRVHRVLTGKSLGWGGSLIRPRRRLRLRLLRGRDARHPQEEHGRQDLPGVGSGNVASIRWRRSTSSAARRDALRFRRLHLRSGRISEKKLAYVWS